MVDFQFSPVLTWGAKKNIPIYPLKCGVIWTFNYLISNGNLKAIQNGRDMTDGATYVFYAFYYISGCTEQILTCYFILKSSKTILLDSIHHFSR
jgi:hypothetical protein